MKNIIINFCSIILSILIFIWLFAILAYIIFFPMQDIKSPYFNLKDELEALFWFFLILYLIYSSYSCIKNLNKIGITIYNFVASLIPVLTAIAIFLSAVYL